MNNFIKTALMIMVAVSIVVAFSVVAPKQEIVDDVAQTTIDYQTEYTLQNLIKTYDLTQDTGHFIDLESRVDYCETE